jgi:hypothetical protein
VNFFSILIFFYHYFRNKAEEAFFFKSDPFKSRQSVYRDLGRSRPSSPGATQGAGTCLSRHADRDRATSYQSHQLDRRDRCLSRASLFGATQFTEYLTPSFSFFFFTFFFFLRSLSTSRQLHWRFSLLSNPTTWCFKSAS